MDVIAIGSIVPKYRRPIAGDVLLCRNLDAVSEFFPAIVDEDSFVAGEDVGGGGPVISR